MYIKNISSVDHGHLFNRQFGITTSAGNDTSLEVKLSPGGFHTANDSIQQHSSGFTLMPTIGASQANINGDTYVFYAIANST